MTTNLLGRRGYLSAAAAVLALAWVAAASAPTGAAAASAGTRYYTPPTPYHNVGTFDPGCRRVDVKVKYDYKGISSDAFAPKTHGQGFFHKDVYDFSETWTRKGSGEVLLNVQGHRKYQELTAKYVRKSAVPKKLIPKKGLIGPIFRFTARETGHDSVTDSHSNVLAASYGTIVYKQLFDTKGDAKPGGRSLSFRAAKVIGPHPDVDLCRLAAQIAS